MTQKILEAAAKACGISVKPMEIKNVTQHGDDRFIGLLSEDWPRGWFNPLTSSADCAAMCAKLDINTFFGNLYVNCYTEDDLVGFTQEHDKTREGKEAALMTAATMVAAKIGGMQ